MYKPLASSPQSLRLRDSARCKPLPAPDRGLAFPGDSVVQRRTHGFSLLGNFLGLRLCGCHAV